LRIDWDLYSPLFKPNAAAYTAIGRDVRTPWTKPASKTLSWRIGRGRASYKVYRLGTPLDGTARVSISGAPGARFRFAGVLSNHGAALSSKGSRSASLTVCGNRSAAFKVRRVAGTGRLKIKLSRP
jgi:hypothetical protein